MNIMKGLEMDNFAEFLGYYVLGITIPDSVKKEFFSSSLEFNDKDQYIIYNMLKNAPNINDITLRQMIIKILEGIR
jgi:hypothetical protein